MSLSPIYKTAFCFKISDMLHFSRVLCLHPEKEGVGEKIGQPHVTLFLPMPYQNPKISTIHPLLYSTHAKPYLHTPSLFYFELEVPTNFSVFSHLKIFLIIM